MSVIDELGEIEVFTALGPVALAWLAEHVVGREFRPGDHIIVQGATDRDCYLLVRGTVDVNIGGHVVGVSHAGNPEGELALLYRTPRSATVVAHADVRALVIRAEDFDRLTGSAPAIAQEIADALVNYVRLRFGRAPARWEPK